MDVRLDNPACADSTGQANEPVEGGDARDAAWFWCHDSPHRNLPAIDPYMALYFGHIPDYPERERREQWRRTGEVLSRAGFDLTCGSFDCRERYIHGLYPDANGDAATAAADPDAVKDHDLSRQPACATDGHRMYWGRPFAYSDLDPDIPPVPKPRRSRRDVPGEVWRGGCVNAGLGESGTTLT